MRWALLALRKHRKPWRVLPEAAHAPSQQTSDPAPFSTLRETAGDMTGLLPLFFWSGAWQHPFGVVLRRK